MASKRADELRASLNRELEVVTHREGYGHLARLLWLRNELENYLDRWLGVVALDDSPYPTLLQGDLFTMVSVAAEIYGERLNESNPRPGEAEWRQFRAALTRAEVGKDREALAGLRELLVAVGKALSH